MNGVCVRFRGYIDVERLDGSGCLEYDNLAGTQEDLILRQQLDRYNSRLREFEQRRPGSGNIDLCSNIWRR